MRRPFEPVGDEARWKLIYKHLLSLGVGDVVTYERLSEIVGFDIREDRSPYRRARDEFLEVNQRALVNERGIGYKVVDAMAHREEARKKTKEADRRIDSAQQLLANANRNEMTAAEIGRVDAMLGALSGVRDMTRRISRRQDRLEAALKAARRESKENVAELNERLERLEQALRQGPKTPSV